MHNIYKKELISGEISVKIEKIEENYQLEDLMGFGNRNNNKRAFLFVSKVLGKHIPCKPKDIRKIAYKLSKKIEIKGNALFVGFAETATGLSNIVYEEYTKKNQHQKSKNKTLFIHTTRYNLKNKEKFFVFEEEHSHASSHIIYKHKDIENLYPETLVLIDDEFSTGKTCVNFIKEILKKKEFSNIKKINLVCITNWINKENIKYIENNIKEINSNIEIIYANIIKGEYEFNYNKNKNIEYKSINANGNGKYKNHIIKKMKINPRLGIKENKIIKNKNFKSIYNKVKNKIKKSNIKKEKIIILGTGEFSYIPFLIAEKLDKKYDVFYQSTTRSPVLIGNDIEYSLEFKDNYDDNIPNYIYNLNPNSDEYAKIIMILETKNNLKYKKEMKKIFNNKLSIIEV